MGSARLDVSVGDAGDGLGLDGLLHGGQRGLAEQHHFAFLIEREGERADVGVGARELEDVRARCAEARKGMRCEASDSTIDSCSFGSSK